MVLAIIQALTSEKTSQLDLLISLEKLVLQNIAVSRDSTSVLGQVIIEFSFSYFSHTYILFHYNYIFLSNTFSSAILYELARNEVWIQIIYWHFWCIFMHWLVQKYNFLLNKSSSWRKPSPMLYLKILQN